jgi:hypothetical protein
MSKFEFPAFIKLEAKGTDEGKAAFLKAVNETMDAGERRTSEFADEAQRHVVAALSVRPETKNAFTSEIDRAMAAARTSLQDFATSAQRNLNSALTGKVTATGAIDVDVAGARQAATVAEQRAAVARQLAQATQAAALAERDFSQATRLSIAAAKELAESETQAAAAAKAQADQAERLQAELNRTGAAMRGLVAQNDNLTRATGAHRQGLQQLGFQLGDVATMYALGAKPAQIFASQIGQITQAVQLMSGGTSRLAAFLGGPWGIALSTAAIVAGPFIGQLYEMVTGADTARSALQKLIDKQREAAVGALDDTQALIGLNGLRDKRLKIQTELDKVNSGKPQGPLGFSPVTLQKQLREINLQIAEAEGALAASEARRAEIERKGTSTTVEATKAVTGHGRAARVTTAAVQDQAKAVSELDKILAAMTATLKDVQAVSAGDITKPYDRMLERLGAGQSEAVKASREASDATADWNDRLSETVRLLEQIGGAGSALGDIGRILGSLSGGNLGALPGAAGIIGKALGGVTWQTVDSDGNRMVRQLGDEFASVLDNVFGSRGSFSKVLESAGIGSAAGQVFLGSKGGNIGSAIGGALGKEAGAALFKGVGGALGKLGGPLGSIVGGVLGGALGSAFTKVSKGYAVVTNGGVTAGGNNADLTASSRTSGTGIQAALANIAEQLGGSIGNYAVSIGKRSSGWIRVSASGSSAVADKSFAKRGGSDLLYNGRDEAEALRVALLNALQDGAIKGIRDGAQRLLKAGGDIDTALRKALSFETVFRDLKAIKDPVGSALDSLNLEFRRLIDIFKEAGASTAEMAQLEELYGIKRADAVRDANERILGSLKGLKEFLGVNSDFYSLRDRQAQAQAIFNPLADRVRAGDATAFDAFSKAAQDLLEIERQISGSTGAFFARADEIKALTDAAIAGKQATADAAAATDSPFAALATQQQATVNAIDAQTSAIVAALENRLGLRLDTLNDNLIAAYRTGAATGSTTDPTTLLGSAWYR